MIPILHSLKTRYVLLWFEIIVELDDSDCIWVLVLKCHTDSGFSCPRAARNADKLRLHTVRFLRTSSLFQISICSAGSFVARLSRMMMATSFGSIEES